MIRNTQPRIGTPQKGVWGVFANQCPLIGGAAVFKARTLLFFIEGYHVYNDMALCNLVGINYREKATQITTSNFKVYPNPTSQNVIVEYQITNDCDATFTFYNTIGQPVIIQSLSAKQNQVTIDLSKLAASMYHYKINCDDAILNFGKITIIK